MKSPLDEKLAAIAKRMKAFHISNTKEMVKEKNPFDFEPLLGKKYQEFVVGMARKKKVEFDTWHLEQDNRKRLAKIRDAEICLMLNALSDHEKGKGRAPNESHMCLHFAHGWFRACDDLEDFSRMLDNALDTAGIKDYCLECMKRKCECVHANECCECGGDVDECKGCKEATK
jgi:hypothetical protein